MQIEDINTENNPTIPAKNSNFLQQNPHLKSLANNLNFDSKNPPSPELIDACVHCGFCLSTCPSYRVIGKEMDSPRGRIYTMNAINNGVVSLNQTSSKHGFHRARIKELRMPRRCA